MFFKKLQTTWFVLESNFSLSFRMVTSSFASFPSREISNRSSLTWATLVWHWTQKTGCLPQSTIPAEHIVIQHINNNVFVLFETWKHFWSFGWQGLQNISTTNLKLFCRVEIIILSQYRFWWVLVTIKVWWGRHIQLVSPKTISTPVFSRRLSLYGPVYRFDIKVQYTFN